MKIAERVTKKTNFIRRKFHLDPNFIYCPISKNNYDQKKFILNIDKTITGDFNLKKKLIFRVFLCVILGVQMIPSRAFH